MDLTIIRAPGARSWVIACALALVLMPLIARAADWQMSGNDLTNDRNQPHETLIDVGNVATLKPAWTFKTLGSVSATPLVTGGYVYVSDRGGGLHNSNDVDEPRADIEGLRSPSGRTKFWCQAAFKAFSIHPTKVVLTEWLV